MMPAAPTPCRARVRTRIGRVGDRAQPNDDTVKSTRPARKTRRYVKTSPSDANGSNTAMAPIWKAVTIAIDALGGVPKSCAMVGNATFAMLLSSTDIASASQIPACAERRVALPGGLASAGWSLQWPSVSADFWWSMRSRRIHAALALRRAPTAPPKIGPLEGVAFFDGNTVPLWTRGFNYEPCGVLERIASTTAAGLLRT